MKRARRRGKWWSSHQKGGENGKDDDVSENAGDASANAASDDDVDDDDVDDVDVSDMNDVDNSSPEEALDGENSLEANDPHRRRSGGKGPRQAITGRRGKIVTSGFLNSCVSSSHTLKARYHLKP